MSRFDGVDKELRFRGAVRNCQFLRFQKQREDVHQIRERLETERPLSIVLLARRHDPVPPHKNGLFATQAGSDLIVKLAL
ncbi:MAG: hypothetical protein JWM87_2858 [Candidatus Eremiobacteraeota bacterium]|nr:hypothetical protein [Candidatus Eremiobacteraeota bacterium]